MCRFLTHKIQLNYACEKAFKYGILDYFVLLCLCKNKKAILQKPTLF